MLRSVGTSCTVTISNPRVLYGLLVLLALYWLVQRLWLRSPSSRLCWLLKELDNAEVAVKHAHDECEKENWYCAPTPAPHRRLLASSMSQLLPSDQRWPVARDTTRAAYDRAEADRRSWTAALCAHCDALQSSGALRLSAEEIEMVVEDSLSILSERQQKKALSEASRGALKSKLSNVVGRRHGEQRAHVRRPLEVGEFVSRLDRDGDGEISALEL